MMANDIECLSCTYLPSVCIFGEMSIHVFCPFANQIGFSFLLLSIESSLYIIDISPLSDMGFTNMFSQSISCLFILLTGTFQSKVLTFDEVHHFFPFIHYAFAVNSKISSPNTKCYRFSPKSFIDVCFIFDSMMHLSFV